MDVLRAIGNIVPYAYLGGLGAGLATKAMTRWFLNSKQPNALQTFISSPEFPQRVAFWLLITHVARVSLERLLHRLLPLQRESIHRPIIHRHKQIIRQQLIGIFSLSLAMTITASLNSRSFAIVKYTVWTACVISILTQIGRTYLNKKAKVIEIPVKLNTRTTVKGQNGGIVRWKENPQKIKSRNERCHRFQFLQGLDFKNLNIPKQILDQMPTHNYCVLFLPNSRRT